MQRLLYLFRRWLMLFRINQLEKQQLSAIYTPLVLAAYLKIIDVNVFRSVDVPHLRKTTITLHYTREQLLTILERAKGAVIYDVLKSTTPQHIPGALVSTTGLKEYHLSTYLVGDTGAPMKIEELLSDLQHYVLIIAQNLEKLDPSEKDYYDRRLQLVWYDINEILATTLSLVE